MPRRTTPPAATRAAVPVRRRADDDARRARLARRRAQTAEAWARRITPPARRAVAACWRQALAEFARLGALPAEALRRDWEARLETVLLRHAIPCAAGGCHLAAAESGRSDAAPDPRAGDVALVAADVAEAARRAADTLLRRAAAACARSDQPGIAPRARLRRLRELAQADALPRAERLARTTAARALALGLAAAWRERGFRLARWIAFSSRALCPRCRDMDGRVVPLDLGPAVLPPLHPNCRCTLAPLAG